MQTPQLANFDKILANLKMLESCSQNMLLTSVDPDIEPILASSQYCKFPENEGSSDSNRF
jgi:hypothetical protein